jgi:hypothetical protein
MKKGLLEILSFALSMTLVALVLNASLSSRIEVSSQPESLKNSEFELGLQSTDQTPPHIYGLNIGFKNVSWNNPQWIQELVASEARWVRTEIRYFNRTIYDQNHTDVRLNLQPCRNAHENGLKVLAIFNEKINEYKGNKSTARAL